MAPDLHRDPATLRAGRSAVEALLPTLDVAGLDPVDLRVLAGLPGGTALVSEHDRLVSAAGRARRELADLADRLEGAARGLDTAEQGAVRALWVVDR